MENGVVLRFSYNWILIVYCCKICKWPSTGYGKYATKPAILHPNGTARSVETVDVAIRLEWHIVQFLKRSEDAKKSFDRYDILQVWSAVEIDKRSWDCLLRWSDAYRVLWRTTQTFLRYAIGCVTLSLCMFWTRNRWYSTYRTTWQIIDRRLCTAWHGKTWTSRAQTLDIFSFRYNTYVSRWYVDLFYHIPIVGFIGQELVFLSTIRTDLHEIHNRCATIVVRLKLHSTVKLHS